MPLTPSAGTSGLSPSPAGAPRRGAPVDPFAQSLVGEFLTERKEEREAEARRRRPGPPWRRILSVAAIVACGAVWLIPSLGTRPAPAMSAERRDASVRLALFLASQRVHDYEKRQGRLPTTAAQSGIADQRIMYRLTGQKTFVLSLMHEGKRWDLPSTAADSTYMRDALSRLGIIAKPK